MAAPHQHFFSKVLKERRKENPVAGMGAHPQAIQGK
jgi:hypothetical protein